MMYASKADFCGFAPGIPSIQHQTGWKRPYPRMLCQDLDVLLRITQYDFDLSDPEFHRYAEQRGVLYVAGREGSPRWRFTGDFTQGRGQFLTDSCFRFAQEYPVGSGVRHMYTPDEVAFHWKVMCIARAKLQDAWEIYKAENQPKGGPERARKGGRHG
jgi:hypothetical protein